MKKTTLTLILFSIIALNFTSCKKSKPTQHTIPIEGLFSLTGNWSSLGVTSKAAVELAVEDINNYLTATDANFRLSSSVSDTKLDVDLAKNLFTKAKNNNVSFVIGPQSSAELAAIKPLSDNAQVIVVSQSSTAGSLAIQNDAIFRFCPSDKIEGAAMAATIAKAGFKGLVTVARDDAGNKGLQTSTGEAFTVKGGQTVAITPYSTSLTNYAAVVADLRTQVNSLIAIHGATKVGIYLASFDEGVEIFKLAAADPVLSNLKWFGGDGVVLSSAFINNATVADFVIKTGFFAPSFGLPLATQASWKPIADRIKAKTQTEPDAFALVAYDAMWTIAYTLEANGGTAANFTKLKSLFVEQANKHVGIVGPQNLDVAGDRAGGTFDYFGVVKEGNSYVWKLVGKSE